MSAHRLFFDEADALLGKRSKVKDAHDRYANGEIAFFPERMESFDGVTILAKTRRGVSTARFCDLRFNLTPI